jgi:riboflavin synthase
VFTGLVEEKGTVAARTARGPGARLFIRCGFGLLELGESISVDGVCLTVDAIMNEGFEVDASAETLARTTLGAVRVGGEVNLERALALGARLGGHIVTGHVDGVGSLVVRRAVGDAVAMTFELPAELARFVAEKGSITVDGVSLTVNGVAGTRFDVTLIPRTLRDTTLGALEVGGKVNLEVDVLARYVARLIGADGGSGGSGDNAAWMDRLRRAGFV